MPSSTGLGKEIFIAGYLSDQLPIVVGAVAARGIFEDALAMGRCGGEGAVVTDRGADEISVKLLQFVQDNGRLFNAFIEHGRQYIFQADTLPIFLNGGNAP